MERTHETGGVDGEDDFDRGSRRQAPPGVGGRLRALSWGWAAWAGGPQLVAASAGQANAETSSWVQREEAPAKPKRMPAPATAEAKPDRSLVGPNVSPHSKDYQQSDKSKRPPVVGKPPADNDDAYLAFDQGRYLTALALAEKLVAMGDAAAHSLIARIHAEGLGVAKNDQLAAQWYKRAAELGDIEGQFAYGVILAEGRGVQKDRSGAAVNIVRARRPHRASRRQLQSRACCS